MDKEITKTSSTRRNKMKKSKSNEIQTIISPKGYLIPFKSDPIPKLEIRMQRNCMDKDKGLLYHLENLPNSPQIRGRIWWEERVRDKKKSKFNENNQQGSKNKVTLGAFQDQYLSANRLRPPKGLSELSWFSDVTTELSIELQRRPSTPLPTDSDENCTSVLNNDADADSDYLYCEDFGIKDSLTISLEDLITDDEEELKLSDMYKELQQKECERKNSTGSSTNTNSKSRLGPHFFSKSVRKILLLLKFKPHSQGSERVLSIPIEQVSIRRSDD